MDVGRLISIRRIEEQPVWSGRSGPQNRWQRSQCTRLPAESARDNPGLANAENFLRAAAAARDRGMHRFPGLRRCAKNLLDQTPFGFGKTIASWVLNGRTRFCFAQGLCPRRSPRAPPAPGILGIGNCPAKSYHTPLTREAGLVQRLGHHPPPGFWGPGACPRQAPLYQNRHHGFLVLLNRAWYHASVISPAFRTKDAISRGGPCDRAPYAKPNPSSLPSANVSAIERRQGSPRLSGTS